MKKKSRIAQLFLIILLGILVVYNVLNPSDINDTSGSQESITTIATSSGISLDENMETLQEASLAETSETTSEVESEQLTTTEAPTTIKNEPRIKESGEYTSKEDVAEYLHLYGHLPNNYITKDEARDLGWVSSEGNLWEVAPGKSIGGDYFGNYEGLLPKKSGRKYYECDIDFEGSYRGAKRIIFSNDGLIYYTEDHYESFEQLYGEK